MPLPTRQKNDDLFFWQVEEAEARRGVIYGPGGIGKTRLCCFLPGPVAFIEPDNSLGSLISEFKSSKVPIPRIVRASNWTELLDVTSRYEKYKDIKSLVIDSGSIAEEWCIGDVLETVKGPSGSKASSLEDYGFGKDVRYVYEHFLPFINQLSVHHSQGRNVVIICHDCKPEEVNPLGTNYVRFEPRLRTSKRGDNSIRLKVKEWADFVGFLCYDVTPKVEEDKKTAERTKKAARQKQTRTLYLSERPQYMAKGRGCPEQIDIDIDTNPWPQIIK
jgi:hypothetical protein